MVKDENWDLEQEYDEVGLFWIRERERMTLDPLPLVCVSVNSENVHATGSESCQLYKSYPGPKSDVGGDHRCSHH